MELSKKIGFWSTLVLYSNISMILQIIGSGKQFRRNSLELLETMKTNLNFYIKPVFSLNNDVILLLLQMRWKPAYDFMVTWRTQAGDSYRDVLQDVHTALDRMREPPTHSWHVPTGLLMLVNGLEVLQAHAFRPNDD